MSKDKAAQYGFLVGKLDFIASEIFWLAGNLTAAIVCMFPSQSSDLEVRCVTLMYVNKTLLLTFIQSGTGQTELQELGLPNIITVFPNRIVRQKQSNNHKRSYCITCTEIVINRQNEMTRHDKGL